AILIVLFCLGRLKGERHFSFNLLAVAGGIVLLINPSDLFGLGPQLSFLAVAALTFGRDWVFWPPSRDPVKRLIAGTRPWPVRYLHWAGRQTRTAFLVSGLIWGVAMPLVAYRFHLVAPVALAVNPLLLLPIAWGLYAGLGVLVFGKMLPPVASLCGWCCEQNLAFIEWMIGIAHSIPGGHVWTSGPTLGAMLIFYGGVWTFAIYPPTRLSGRWLSRLAIAWFLCCWLGPDLVAKQLAARSAGSLKCTVIDVGHGSSVLLELPGGKHVLYDCGSFGAAEYGARNIAGVLWSQRIKHLDAVILSHADVDHFNALPFLIEKFSIETVYATPHMFSNHSPAAVAMFESLRQHGVEIEQVSSGDSILNSALVSIQVLSPTVSRIPGNDNANSLVVLLECHGRKLLLPGDLEREGLRRLFEYPPIDCDILMAAHHGSQNSQPEDFMAWATPEYVAISGGSQRVSEDAVTRFQGDHRRVLRTDQDGAIRFTIDRDNIQAEFWSGEGWDDCSL
ncbi:MAG: competence protein ComEC, partial [Mariniblastus sp.]